MVILDAFPRRMMHDTPIRLGVNNNAEDTKGFPPVIPHVLLILPLPRVENMHSLHNLEYGIELLFSGSESSS